MPILAASIADRPFTSGSASMKDYPEGLPARSHTSAIAENVTRDEGDNASAEEMSIQSDEEQEYIEAQEGEEIRDDLIIWERLASHSHVVESDETGIGRFQAEIERLKAEHELRVERARAELERLRARQLEFEERHLAEQLKYERAFDCERAEHRRQMSVEERRQAERQFRLESARAEHESQIFVEERRQEEIQRKRLGQVGGTLIRYLMLAICKCKNLIPKSKQREDVEPYKLVNERNLDLATEEEEFGKAKLGYSLNQVRHGMLDENSVSMIILDLNFNYDDTCAITRANITITFSSEMTEKSDKPLDIEVVPFATDLRWPKKALGPSSNVHLTDETLWRLKLEVQDFSIETLEKKKVTD